MIDFSQYPHLPHSHRVLAREFEEIICDETENPETRRYFQSRLDLLLDGASDIEQIVSEAEMRGYSQRLNEHHGYRGAD